MALAAVALGLAALLGGPAGSTAADRAALQEAAVHYHQGRFDTARVRLAALLDAPGWRRRDSVVMLQYLGMSEARLGADSAATEHFAALLAADSLFRFARNEDAAVLRTFEAARDRRPASASPIAAEPALAPVRPAETRNGGAPSPAGPQSDAVPAGDPLAALAADPPPAAKMSLALGAVPLGGGWMARQRSAHGLTLGFLQAGGILLSLYASERQSGMQYDAHGLQESERGSAVGWQWVQGISLSTALGAYLFSLIASGRE